MEYTTPGGAAIKLFAAILTSAVILGTILAPLASGQHHDIRHGRHYNKQSSGSGHRFHGLDYEDSTIVMQPEFLNTKHNITVREGEMASLPCAVRNLGTKQVAWRRIGDKDDHFLTVGTFTWVRENNIQVDHKLEEGQVSRWNLIIKSVEKNDEGTYQCQITDKVPLRIHVYLTVKPRPAAKPAVTLTGKEYVDSNEPIRLICNATGGSKIPEDIDWFKDGTKLDSKNRRDPNIVLTKYMSLEDQALISELFIEHADINDSGSYICRSSDRELDSIKVTVLVADTTNVKRGTGVHQEAQIKGTSCAVLSTAMLSPLVILSFFLHLIL